MILLLKDCFGIFVENRLNGARLRVKIIAFCREVSVFLVAQSVKSLPAMWDTWVQSLGREDPLEKEMATHSSILAWRIPWREESGGL